MKILWDCPSTYCEINKKMQQNANKTRDLISSSALVSEKSSSQWKLVVSSMQRCLL